MRNFISSLIPFAVTAERQLHSQFTWRVSAIRETLSIDLTHFYFPSIALSLCRSVPLSLCPSAFPFPFASYIFIYQWLWVLSLIRAALVAIWLLLALRKGILICRGLAAFSDWLHSLAIGCTPHSGDVTWVRSMLGLLFKTVLNIDWIEAIVLAGGCIAQHDNG